MSKMKLCGLSREQDIKAVNEIKPDYIGFVFAKKSKRYVSPERAAELKAMLSPGITAVGVFVNETVENVAQLLNNGTIDIAQLHGKEDNEYIAQLRGLSCKPIIQAFKIACEADLEPVEASKADYVLLDSGAGTGTVFDWSLIKNVKRPYFLAGGLSPENVAAAIAELDPYAVDVSSGIETDGLKDAAKMEAFAANVRREEQK